MSDMIIKIDLPEYKEIPDVGLYLEQVVRYVNEKVEALGVSVTTSMVSNYVKKGYIERPVKKLYYARHIAYIIFIVICKQVLSMENMATLFELQRATYDTGMAYDAFCRELKEMLLHILQGKDELPVLPADADFEQRTLRSVAIAVAHIISLNYYFQSKQQF